MIFNINDYITDDAIQEKIDAVVNAAIEKAANEYFGRVIQPKLALHLNREAGNIVKLVMDIAISLTHHAAKKVRMITGDTTPPVQNAKEHNGPPDRKCKGCGSEKEVKNG